MHIYKGVLITGFPHLCIGLLYTALTSPLKRLYSKKGLADLLSYSLRRRARVEDWAFLAARGTTSFCWKRLWSTGEREGGERERERGRERGRESVCQSAQIVHGI